MIPLRLADELASLVRLGLVQAEPVSIAVSGPDLVTEVDALGADLASRYGGRSPSEIPALGPARALYRAFGIDPTHTRPSSEALLRRVLQGKDLPRILNAVDLCNFCSLRFLLSIGLYDAGKIRGSVVLRRGRPGESYTGIRKDDVNLAERPVLADDEGPFGNPTSDSVRTSVTTATSSLWMVIFAPADFSRDEMTRNADFARDLMKRYLGGEEVAVRTEGAVLPT